MAQKDILIKITLDQAAAKQRTTELTQEIARLTAEQKKYTKILKDSNGANKKAAEELNKVKVQLKTNRTELNALNKVQSVNNNSLGALRVKNSQLQKSLEKVNTSTKKGQANFRRLSKEIGVNQRQINKLDTATKRFQGNVGNYAGGITQSLKGIAAGYLGIYAAIRLVTSTFNKMKEFEKTFTNVLTLLNEADKTQWGGLLRKQSAQLIKEFGFEIADTNKALFDAISAGVHVSEVYKFLRENAILAKGGVTTLGEATDGATSIMNAYGIEVENTNKITSAFFTAQKFGKTTVGELTKEIGVVAPIAKTAGVSFQELLSTYAELTKQGIKTTDATTAIKATILALIKPSEQAKKTFADLNIEVGLNAIRNQGLFTVLQKVSEAAEIDADALTQLIPNIRALTGVAALGTEAIADYDLILKEVNEDYGEGSSLSIAYDEQVSTLSDTIDLAGGAWTNFIISLEDGDGVISEFLKGAITGFTDFFNAMALANTSFEELDKLAKARAEKKLLKETIEAETKAVKEYGEAYFKTLETQLSGDKIILEGLIKLKEERKNHIELRAVDGELIKSRDVIEFENLQKKIDFNQQVYDAVKATLDLQKTPPPPMEDVPDMDLSSFLNLEFTEEDAEILNQSLLRLNTIIKENKAAFKLEEDALELEDEQTEDDEALYLAEKYQATLDGKLVMLKANHAAGLILDAEYNDKLKILEEKKREETEKLDKLSGKEKLKMAAQSLDALSGLFKEGSGAAKILASGSAIINTYAGATAALAPPPLGLGPVAGIPLMISTIIAGLANVAKINGVGFAEGYIPKSGDGKGGTIKGNYISHNSDNVLHPMNPREAIINARTMQSSDVMTLSGTPYDIANGLNTYKGYGRGYAAGYVPPQPTNQMNITNNSGVSMAQMEGMINSVNSRIDNIKVINIVEETSEMQQFAHVINEQGNI